MTAIRRPAMAGPTMRDALNMEEFSAMAFMRSALPTISAMKDWRAGMSKELISPSNAKCTKMCQTCTVLVRVRAAMDEGQQHGGGLGRDDHAPAAVTIGDDAGDGGEQKERNLDRKSTRLNSSHLG